MTEELSCESQCLLSRGLDPLKPRGFEFHHILVRVAGVPEHFNLPWHIANDRNIFQKYGVKVCISDSWEGSLERLSLLR
jgi:hypothetical protein